MNKSPRPNYLRQANRIVADLQQPNPWIYWIDFLASMTLGYGAAMMFFNAPWWSIEQTVCFLIAGFALYRLGSFIHEIVHFRSHEMRAFRIAWDLLAGIAMLTPSFFYENHRDHHNARHYGTEHDGEYLPLGNGALRDVVLFLMQVFVQPILVVLRFLLAPLTFLHPRLRQWTLRHASSFVIDFRYQRPVSGHSPLYHNLLDLACSMRAWGIFVALLLGVTDWTRLPQLYMLATFVLGVNYFRTLSAHRYLSGGQRLTHEQQLLDSTTVTGVPLWTELVCPLGMRYHALHHLFPRLPYHNLGIAHRRLMAQLPAGSPYHETVYPTCFAAIAELLRHVRGQEDMPQRGESGATA
ncbi:fatty acid desaturase family protein [Roseimaritima ulvae]|uniref:Fatty acid desaturase n=1 Tax=Roseimaritima ulvae TaxID=980254 RepID=A0A5B9R7N5_9BACT|nr:fatty acid desaturase [Roseimaritima ulvae]QEG42731.1 Fatty acid desaturase [Roseimaritima ulvae]